MVEIKINQINDNHAKIEQLLLHLICHSVNCFLPRQTRQTINIKYLYLGAL